MSDAAGHHPGDPECRRMCHGHKWLTSAPMCDIFRCSRRHRRLSLPAAAGAARRHPQPNVLQRLKDKLFRNHANASSEVEYDGSRAAWLVARGCGAPTIIEMVNLTRLDCDQHAQPALTQPSIMPSIGRRSRFDRPAVDAQRAGRPGGGGRGRHHRGNADLGRLPTTRCAGTRPAVTAQLAAAKYLVSPLTPLKRWSAWAATAVGDLDALAYREAPLMGNPGGLANVSALDTCAMATRPGHASRWCLTSWPAAQARTPGWTATSEWLSAASDLDTIGYRSPQDCRISAWRCRDRCWCATDIPAVAEAFGHSPGGRGAERTAPCRPVRIRAHPSVRW